MRPDVLAEHLGQTIRGLFQPVALKVAELEASGGRVAAHLGAVEASVGDLGARLAALEGRPPEPGPPGPQGPPGPAGPPGLDGKGWTYRDTYGHGQSYDVGDCVTDKGSLFYCKRQTTDRPGESPDWRLMVKRGQDGKDLRGAR